MRTGHKKAKVNAKIALSSDMKKSQLIPIKH